MTALIDLEALLLREGNLTPDDLALNDVYPRGAIVSVDNRGENRVRIQSLLLSGYTIQDGAREFFSFRRPV